MNPWVLLRGLMRESRHWGEFPELFKRALPDAAVVLLDLPGTGALCHEDSPSSVAEMVGCYRAALLARGIRPPYRLLALSLGGMAAVEWAHRYPEELEACILLNTSLRPFSPFHRRLRWQNYHCLLRMALAADDIRLRENTILELTSNRPDLRSLHLPAWIAYQRQYPVSRLNALRQLRAAARYSAPLRAPAVPMLLLASAGDRLVDCSCSLTIAARWSCELSLHRDAGHDLPLDDGAWVIAQIERWLRSRRAKDRA